MQQVIQHSTVDGRLVVKILEELIERIDEQIAGVNRRSRRLIEW